MQRKSPKPKKCKVCGTLFEPKSHFAKACRAECALELVRRVRDKKAATANRQQERILKAETKAMKEAVRPLKWYADRAKEACHEYIRFRDRMEPCISCGRHHQGQYHAGHYRPSGVNSALRYDERNIHKQCAPCNTHKSGNLSDYRQRLVCKIGERTVLDLEQNNEVRKYSKEDLIEIRNYYKQKLIEAKQ